MYNVHVCYAENGVTKIKIQFCTLRKNFGLIPSFVMVLFISGAVYYIRNQMGSALDKYS